MIYRITSTYDVTDVSLCPLEVASTKFQPIPLTMPTNSNRIPTIVDQFRPDGFSWNSVELRLSNSDYFRPFPNNADGNADGNVDGNADKHADQCLTVATISN